METSTWSPGYAPGVVKIERAIETSQGTRGRLVIGYPRADANDVPADDRAVIGVAARLIGQMLD